MKKPTRCEEILKQHHIDLKNDPERLSTKFIADVAGCECRLIYDKSAMIPDESDKPVEHRSE
jgi:hypothetical protein